MIDNRKDSPKTWIVLYAALLIAVAFAEPGSDSMSNDADKLSPVAIEGAAPVLDLRSAVRRADI